jgi:hypothetical protein
MTVLTPPGYLQGGTYTAKLDRIYLATLGNIPNLASTFSARQGFLGGRVPTYANPSGMDITMSACGAVIANTFASASGDYLMANDASVQVTLAASSPTLNRYDIIGFQVKDNLFDSSGLNTAVPAVIQGANSAGTPSDPALPSSFIPVLRAVVNATNTSPFALQSLIRKTSSEGGLMKVANVTERAEITAHDGLQIYREDRDWVEINDGTAWRVQGVAVCTSTADRDSAITNPYNGQLAVTTDLGIVWRRHAGAWGTLYGNAGTTLDARQDTAGTTTSGSFTATLTGTTRPSGTFVAPASGVVDVYLTAQVSDSDTSDLAICGYEVRSGAVVGSGTVVQAAEIPRSLYSGTTQRCTMVDTVTGLSAGTTYNIGPMYAVTGDTGTYSNQQVKVRPVG